MPGKPLLRHKDKSMQRGYQLKTQWYATLPHRWATSATNTRKYMTTDSTWQLTSLLSSHSCCPITGLDALMPWVDIYILSHQWFWVRAYLVGQKLISVIVRLLPRWGAPVMIKGGVAAVWPQMGLLVSPPLLIRYHWQTKKDAFQLEEIEDRSKV